MTEASWVGRRDAAALAVAVSLLLVQGCRAEVAYECDRDEQCVLGATKGICAAPGFCAFPADDCPTGYRFGEHAGSFAGQCVPDPDDSSATSSAHGSSSTGQPQEDTDGSSSEPTTGEGSETTTAETDDDPTAPREPSCTPLWQDDLSDGSTWHWSAGPDVDVSFGPGGLVITPNPETPGYGNLRWPEALPSGVEVTVRLIEALQSNVGETMISIFDLEGEHRLLFYVSSERLYMHVRMGDQEMLTGGPDHDPRVHRYLRTRNVGGTVTFSVSEDGVLFSELWTTEAFPLDTGDYYLGLGAGIWGAINAEVGRAHYGSVTACAPNE